MTERYHMLVSFPRSGTDFFCQALKQEPEIRYAREYFNPICTPRHEDLLSTCFGDERLKNFYNIFGETTQSSVDHVVAETWELENLNATKENFSALRVEYLRKYFGMACLVRNVSHTFPTSRPQYIVPILNSFMLSGRYNRCFLAPKLNALRNIVADIRITDMNAAGVMAYMVQHYTLLAACREFSIPIITYEDIVYSDDAALASRLEIFIPFGARPLPLAGRLIEKRPADPVAAMRERREKFATITSISWLGDLRQKMQALSPSLADDIERYLTPIPL